MFQNLLLSMLFFVAYSPLVWIAASARPPLPVNYWAYTSEDYPMTERMGPEEEWFNRDPCWVYHCIVKVK
jgi:hypothetical protein